MKKGNTETTNRDILTSLYLCIKHKRVTPNCSRNQKEPKRKKDYCFLYEILFYSSDVSLKIKINE